MAKAHSPSGFSIRCHGGRARFLDDPQTRLAAENDPVGFLDFDGLMLIDEVHRVPGLWLAIKNTVDRDPRPGRFILTGSARLLALQSLPDALPGRTETIEPRYEGTGSSPTTSTTSSFGT